MNAEERRRFILQLLSTSSAPLTGTELGEQSGVSRQVIVQDIALLRATGVNVLATPQGYVLIQSDKRDSFQRTIACIHQHDHIGRELETIIDLGGKVVDVIVEHPVYGEIRGMLMLSSRDDIRRFVDSLQATHASPLSSLTKGVHLHTIEVKSEEQFSEIKMRLKKQGYLLE